MARWKAPFLKGRREGTDAPDRVPSAKMKRLSCGETRDVSLLRRERWKPPAHPDCLHLLCHGPERRDGRLAVLPIDEYGLREGHAVQARKPPSQPFPENLAMTLWEGSHNCPSKGVYLSSFFAMTTQVLGNRRPM